MPCRTTSYPHGTIPGERRFLVFLAEECDNTCVVATTSYLQDEAVSLQVCDLWINGQCPGSFDCGGDINTFDYVSAGMVCEPCSTFCTEGESSAGCNWSVGLSYCCADSVVKGTNSGVLMEPDTGEAC